MQVPHQCVTVIAKTRRVFIRRPGFIKITLGLRAHDLSQAAEYLMRPQPVPGRLFEMRIALPAVARIVVKQKAHFLWHVIGANVEAFGHS
jgi:hypothetical protein